MTGAAIPPRFDYVLTSQADRANQSIRLTFQGADQQAHTIEVSARCAALTLAAMAAHLGELLSGLPREQYPEVQPIVVDGANAIPTGDGGVALILRLEGGADLPLEFSGPHIARVTAQLNEIASGPRGALN